MDSQVNQPVQEVQVVLLVSMVQVTSRHKSVLRHTRKRVLSPHSSMEAMMVSTTETTDRSGPPFGVHQVKTTQSTALFHVLDLAAKASSTLDTTEIPKLNARSSTYVKRTADTTPSCARTERCSTRGFSSATGGTTSTATRPPNCIISTLNCILHLMADINFPVVLPVSLLVVLTEGLTEVLTVVLTVVPQVVLPVEVTLALLKVQEVPVLSSLSTTVASNQATPHMDTPEPRPLVGLSQEHRQAAFRVDTTNRRHSLEASLDLAMVNQVTVNQATAG